MRQKVLTRLNIANGVVSGLMLASGVGVRSFMSYATITYMGGFAWLVSGFLGIQAALLKQKNVYITQMVFGIYCVLFLIVYLAMFVDPNYWAWSIGYIGIIGVLLLDLAATILCGILAFAKKDNDPVRLIEENDLNSIVQNPEQFAAYAVQTNAQPPRYIVQGVPVALGQVSSATQAHDVTQAHGVTQAYGYIQTQPPAYSTDPPPAYSAQTS